MFFVIKDIKNTTDAPTDHASQMVPRDLQTENPRENIVLHNRIPREKIQMSKAHKAECECEKKVHQKQNFLIV